MTNQELMITLAISAGIWVENDAYVTDGGDVILYDGDDSGLSSMQEKKRRV